MRRDSSPILIQREHFAWLRGAFRVLGVLTGLVCVGLAIDGPVWWMTRDVVSTNEKPNNKALCNLGQLKWIATQARAELEATVIGGAAFTLPTLGTTNNQRPATQGQLKNLAKPFYDRMNAIVLTFARNELIRNGYPSNWTENYPWTATTTDDLNSGLVTLGQLKIVFGFDPSKDSDSDDLSDLNEAIMGLDPNDPDSNDNGVPDGLEDSDGDGVINSLEIRKKSDPRSAASVPANPTSDLEILTRLEK